MLERIQRKYARQKKLAEAKAILRHYGYELLLETPVENFEDSDSKNFLLEVITNLETYGYVSRKEIDAMDRKKGYVWNELNKLARSFDVDRIISYLARLGLYRRRLAA